MSNHYHLVLHVDYERSLSWDAEEVVERWCSLLPSQALKESEDNQLDDEVISAYFLKTPKNFFASNKINGLCGYVPPKINDLRTFPEFSVILHGWWRMRKKWPCGGNIWQI
ncbi:hypothetical protein QUF61_17050 [Candidatus Venteria ishoeyi]|uniref:hypothetical protein n=1 Tax=Candidatus Venteria ishoeyi TaxID=1899563 RepID=UPI0025A5E812|nr:hypothetical protein [Candidatus Venteria ishoeyi]MDM8548200.1 hypothetical protein [Candidatus Venteria ishoeyi]